MRRRARARVLVSACAVVVSAVVFLVPFAFILLTSVKNRQQSALLDFSSPEQLSFMENFFAVIETRDYMLVTAFVNSFMLTTASVAIMVVLAAMVGWVLQRRTSPLVGFRQLHSPQRSHRASGRSSDDLGDAAAGDLQDPTRAGAH